MTGTGDRSREDGVTRAQVRVSPVLVEVAQRRVAEAMAAGREPSPATVLIANAQARSVHETVAVADSATAQVTRAETPLTEGSVRTRKRR